VCRFRILYQIANQTRLELVHAKRPLTDYLQAFKTEIAKNVYRSGHRKTDDAGKRKDIPAVVSFIPIVFIGTTVLF